MSSQERALLELARETLRLHDRDLYLASLLYDPEIRDDLTVLYAFSAQMTRIRELVSEPLPGEIRLQWWRDALINDAKDADAHPLAKLLIDVIERHALARDRFDQIISAHAFDLYHDALLTLNDFETYADETTSLIFQLSAEIASKKRSPVIAAAASHGGLAYCLMNVLRTLRADAQQRRLFLPQDILSQFKGAQEDLLNRKMSAQASNGLRHFLALSRQHLDEARQAMQHVPVEIKPVFRPLALVEPYLALLEKNLMTYFERPIILSQIKAQWVLWRAKI